MSDVQKMGKGFLEKPEGKTGLVLGTLLAGGLAYGFYLALPFLISMMLGFWTLVALATPAALLVFILSDSRWRTLISYGFRSVSRAITGAFIEIDPIGILKTYVEGLHKKLETMRESLRNLEGQKRKLKEIIAKNDAQAKHAMALAGEARKQGVQTALTLQSRQAGRLQKSNLTLQGLLVRIEALSRVLKKMMEASEFMVQDIEGEVQVKSQERAAIKASHNAYTAARKIIQGGTSEKELFDQAMEKVADDYAMKLGEIEQFMEASTGFIQSVDLENGVYEADALAQLDAWEKKSANLLNIRIDDSVAAPLPAHSSGPFTSPMTLEEEESATEFAELFKTMKR
jgi:hypothetical protein